MIDPAHIERMLTRLPVLEAELSQPETAANQKRFRDLVREHAVLKRIQDVSDRWLRLREDLREHIELVDDPAADPDLRDLARAEIEDLEPRVSAAHRELMVALLPPDPDHARNAIMEIRAGTGGDEAALFAGDLFRMYNRYADMHGWKISLVDASPGEQGGYKEIVFSITGNNVYGTLQYESGGHRVQRVPATESQGRIHTSAATVGVFPEAEPEDDIDLPANEIRIDIFRSSGPGGQSVNTTDSAVRVTHLPTGTVVQCQDEKSQHRNREKALAVLKARLLDQKRQEEAERLGHMRRTKIGSGDRNQRIRTYNFPQNRLTDHRINLTLYSLDRIMEGAIDELLETLYEHDIRDRLQRELGVTMD